MNFKIQVIFLTALFAAAFAQYTTDSDGVVILTTSNFDAVIKSNKCVVVEFCKLFIFLILGKILFFTFSLQMPLGAPIAKTSNRNMRK